MADGLKRTSLQGMSFNKETQIKTFSVEGIHEYYSQYQVLDKTMLILLCSATMGFAVSLGDSPRRHTLTHIHTHTRTSLVRLHVGGPTAHSIPDLLGEGFLTGCRCYVKSPRGEPRVVRGWLWCGRSQCLGLQLFKNA